ncbi:hypothetical protein SAMN05444008_11673 [Cnuella takakiae]|uniref:Uncharacterized protein n=1 Tax=Cnuella takakiae TaxID=1302690 RepID=A0A1M5GGT2_9BACT|nr:hypothetical protein [Cnuella takakiae]OLY92416.1 hypothetical protein BUE76_11330 [Cnuella takakiae]SHG02927.1 hypothetical protein SAMN05444008_11673 [Cnuella takakiae]
MEQNKPTPQEAAPNQSNTAHPQQGQPVLVPQNGEIKNNDQDPGAGDQSLANEAGSKDERSSH